MRLSDYLSREGISDAAFGEAIKVSRQAVHRYRTGIRMPDRHTMTRIASVTAGEVTANDFFETPAAETAA